MADETTPDPASFDPTGSSGDDQVSEDELDRLLADATEMATHMSAEVGAPDPGAGELSPTNPPASLLHSQASLDAQLDELDGLLIETGDQLGTQPATSDTAFDAKPNPTTNVVPSFMDEFTRPESGASDATPPSTSTVAPSAPLPAPAPISTPAVPDFMDEFTRPEAPPPPAPAPSSAERPGKDLKSASAASASTTVATTTAPPTKLGVVGAPIVRLDITQPPPASGRVDASQNEPETTGDVDDLLEEELTNRDGASSSDAGVGTRVSAIALKLCEPAIALLNILDRPTQRIGNRPRRLIGWLALATLAASAVVFTISLL